METKDKVPILAAIKKASSEALDAAKKELFNEMEPGDRKSLKVAGEKVGYAVVVDGSRKAQMVDPHAFFAYCAENDVIPTMSIPASWTVGRDPFFTKLGDAYVDRNGEIVPGVRLYDSDPYLMVKECNPENVLPLITTDMLLESVVRGELHD